MENSTVEEKNEQLAASRPPVVSPQDWQRAWEQMLVKEKAQLRSHDALAAERRRMLWQAVEKDYAFDGKMSR